MVALTWKCGKNFPPTRIIKNRASAQQRLKHFCVNIFNPFQMHCCWKFAQKSIYPIVGVFSCQRDDAIACCTTEARPQVDDNNQSMEYWHQGTCNKSPRSSHAGCLAQWNCSPTFSTRELFGKISFGLLHSIGVWRQVSEERC